MRNMKLKEGLKIKVTRDNSSNVTISDKGTHVRNESQKMISVFNKGHKYESSDFSIGVDGETNIRINGDVEVTMEKVSGYYHIIIKEII